MNWTEFIGQYDLIYETPPREWSDGFLLGNGGLGALVSAPHALEWLVNKVDVLDARMPGVKRIIPLAEAKQMIRNGATGHDFNREEKGEPAPSGIGPKSCCQLTMNLGATAGGSRRGGLPTVASRLSLYDATLHLALDKHLFHPRVTSFVCDQDDLLVIRVSDKSPLVAFWTTLYLNRPEDAELPDASVAVERDRLMLEMEMPDAGRYVVGLQVISRPTRAYRQDWLPRLREQYRAPEVGGCRLSVQGRCGIVNVGGDFDLLLTVATVRDAADPRAEVHRRLDRAAAGAFETLQREHAAWWARFWQKSWVELGDKAQEQLLYLSLMELGADGRYHLWPSYAVEIEIINASDSVQTLSMLKVCLETALEASQILKVDETLAVRWRNLLDRFPVYPTATDWRGREVVLEAGGVPAEHHVGQAGCLHPLYPCGEIDEYSDPALVARYQRTYESVLDKTAEKNYAIDHDFFYLCAWECFFRGMAALRLGRAEEFWRVYLPMMLRAYSKPNGMMSHDGHVIVDPAASEANLATIPDYTLEDCGQRMPVFEPWCGHSGSSTPDPRTKEFSHPLIEVNADYLTMMTETLLQSQNGIIRVFPGWPQGRDAQFSNLVAEGQVIVSAHRVGGTVRFVTLRRPDGIALPGGSPDIRLKSPWTGRLETWSLPPGATLTLTKDGPADRSPEQRPLPVEPAQPRVLYADPQATVWLGRKR